MITIKSDSRKILPGDTFIALKCVDNDGHKYIEKAIENGATKIIAEYGTYPVETVIVEDTRGYIIKYLHDKYKDELKKAKIIGLTGTNGKTTSAYMLYQALNKSKLKSAYIGTIGFYLEKKVSNLPNTTVDICDLYELLLQCIENECKYIVMEVSSEGLYRRRVDGIDFDYVAFTNLTQDHLNIHGTMENYMVAKQLLFKYLKKDGKAFINIDNFYSDNFILKENNNITYGFNDSNYQVLEYKMKHTGSIFEYKHNAEIIKIKTSLIGKYNLYNLILVISILTEIGIKDIQKVVSFITSPPGRMETVIYKNNSIIIDYAHTPDAIENIITTMKKVTNGKIYVVFGCTGDRDRTKRPIMLKLVTDLVDYAIITNDDPHNENPNQIVNDMTLNVENKNYEVCLDRKIAIKKGIDLLNNHDVLLILGKGHEEVMIIKNEKIPFNDRKIVDSYLN